MMTGCDIVAKGERTLADVALRISGEPGALPAQAASRPGLEGRCRAAVLPPQQFSGKEPNGPSHSHMKED